MRLEPPARIALDVATPEQLQWVMAEYHAIRGEIAATLTNQVAVLSFGAAAVGLAFAAAGSLWDQHAVLTAVLFLAAVPLVSFLTLAVYSGELIRMMRAGLFLNRLEFEVNRCPLAEGRAGEGSAVAPRHVLCWEQWSHIRQGGSDIDRWNRMSIYGVFVLLAGISALAGWFRLRTEPAVEQWATAAALASVVVGGLSLLWLSCLVRVAYRYRTYYRYTTPAA